MSSNIPRPVLEIPASRSSSSVAKDNYQDKDASKDSELKAIWDKQIGEKKSSVVYCKAHVLLLSWHRDDDDLHVEQEVADLENVFRNIFKYQTTQKTLNKQRPQAQINRYLAEFVHEHDDSDTLLIVYYAGHGKLRNGKPGLALTGSTSVPDDDDDDDELHEVVWSSAEYTIQNTLSDVLVIFDCCNAGEMDRNVRGTSFERRAFEYMAATSQSSTTRKPGPNSFTAALIWALEELVGSKPGKRFSTQELVRKIFHAPKFPKDQAPRLTEQGPKGSLRKIVLVPLDQQSETEAPEPKNMKPAEKRETLNVQFVFNKSISKKMIRDLSKDLSNLIGQGDFEASTVLWEGINIPSHEKRKRLRDVVNIWQNHVWRHERFSISGVDRPQISPVTPLIPTESPTSPEESFIDIPSPVQLFPSPAPEIGLDTGEAYKIEEYSDVPKKRRRENGTIHDSEAAGATSKLLSTKREKRLKRRHSEDQPSEIIADDSD
ncbi:hypothetical protein NHQ30_004101 [Ciborinia camelliae]|nr:hypothetical protein NHQ30_004101 [Ciborinia camelliae]